MTEKKKPAAKKPAPKAKATPKRKVAPKSKAKAKPVGRPPFIITKAILGKVEMLASIGYNKTSIAHAIGLSRGTYMAKQLEFPELNDAFTQGRERSVDAAEAKLYSRGVDDGDVPALKYILNNRRPDEWQDKRVVEAGDNLAKSLQSMRPEDRLELLERQEQANV